MTIRNNEPSSFKTTPIFLSDDGEGSWCYFQIWSPALMGSIGRPKSTYLSILMEICLAWGNQKSTIIIDLITQTQIGRDQEQDLWIY